MAADTRVIVIGYGGLAVIIMGAGDCSCEGGGLVDGWSCSSGCVPAASIPSDLDANLTRFYPKILHFSCHATGSSPVRSSQSGLHYRRVLCCVFMFRHRCCFAVNDGQVFCLCSSVLRL